MIRRIRTCQNASMQDGTLCCVTRKSFIMKQFMTLQQLKRQNFHHSNRLIHTGPNQHDSVWIANQNREMAFFVLFFDSAMNNTKKKYYGRQFQLDTLAIPSRFIMIDDFNLI